MKKTQHKMIFSDFVKKKCSRIALKQIVGFIVRPAPVQKMNTTFQRIVLGTKKEGDMPDGTSPSWE
ncbi:MAG: hypothetical protein IJK94_04075 [Bacteroidaceae bacterium]|nr:hypothetical protein [Bacteroidaceae bacterium]